MQPIKAMCRACGRVLLLSEIPQLGSGCCPTCGVLLAPAYTDLLLHDVKRALQLQRDLAACLMRLCELPGNLMSGSGAVYVALAAELPRAEQRRADQAIVTTETRRLRRAVRQWQRLRHGERAQVTPGLVARFRALAQRGRLLGAMNADAAEHDAEQAVLHEAAQAVDEAADAIRSERLHAEMKAADALDRVRLADRHGSQGDEGSDDVAVAA